MALTATADGTGLLIECAGALGRLPLLLFPTLYGVWVSTIFGISFTIRAFSPALTVDRRAKFALTPF
jgi:hypothetical protein